MTQTPARRAASARYQQKQGNITLRPSKEEVETVQEAAKAAGKSVAAYCLEAIRLQMERDSSNKYYIGIPKSAADQAGEKKKQTGEEWLIDVVNQALEKA